MSRSFNGTTQYATRAATYLANSPGPFTISLWFAPANLTDTVKAVLANATGSPWWQLRLDAGVVVFESSGYTGSNPGTGSGITWATTALKHVAWRYKGQGAEWAKWDAGVKSVINAAISFTLPNVGAQFDIARNWSGAHCAGTYAEVAIWNAALPDEYMAELAAGVAADQLLRPSLIAYFPLRGNSSPEINYAVAADTLTLVNAPAQAAHPTTVPPWQADVNASAWVLDLFHPSGTKRIGSTDLTEDVDIDILGAKYTSRLLNDPPISESDPTEQAGGVMLPGQTTVEIENKDGWLDRSWEWRQCPMRLREYDRATHALVTEMVGVVVDPGNMANDRMVFTCAGADEPLLRQLVPRQRIDVANASTGLIDDVDGDLRRADVGRPFPVGFGTGGIVACPFLRIDDVGLPGGADFLVLWGTTGVVLRFWWEEVLDQPGLDLASYWSTAPGTPTSATTTTFTVTGDHSFRYVKGLPVRRSGDAGATWSYSRVLSYSAGTVTLENAILPASPTAIGLVELADMLVEKDRFKFVGDATTFLTSIRFPGDGPTTPVLAEVAEAGRTNPADCIRFILENADQGLDLPVDSASFTQAVADFAAAGLATAGRGTIGGDGTQREGLDTINEFCAMRGAEVWRDPETLLFKIKVDTAPTVQTRTLEFGADTKGNIGEVLSLNRTPLSQAVAVLAMRYAAMGRDRGNKTFTEQDYAYRASMTVLTGLSGTTLEMQSQFLREHSDARRVLYYRGKRRQRSDTLVKFRMSRAGRRVRRGMVFPLLVPSAGIATPTNFRIIARERSLNDFVFTAAGPYDADIYETDIGVINAATSAPTDLIDVEERRRRGNGQNMLANADFSTGLARAGIVFNALPDWTLSVVSGAHLSSIAVTADARAKGGHYLTVVTGAGLPAAGSCPLWLAYTTNTMDAHAAIPGVVYVVSGYIDTTAVGVGWRNEVYWFDAAGSVVAVDTPALIRPVPGDVNGFGWQRYYTVSRCPAGAAYGAPGWRVFESSKTYKLDAVQFEELASVFGLPTEWTRNPSYGLQPGRMTTGALTVRADGEIEAGMQMSASKGTDYDTGGVTLSGTSTVVGTAGPGTIKGMAGRVTTAITGPASWQLALDFGGGALTPFLDVLPIALNSTFADDKQVSGPIVLPAAVNIVAIPASGSFSGGKVKVFANVERTIPPTS